MIHLEIHHNHLEVKIHIKIFLWQQIIVRVSVLKRGWEGYGSLCWLEARLGFCLLLLLVEDDADDVPLVLLHVLHQPLFTC